MESFILFYEKCRLCLDKAGVFNLFENEEFPQDIYLCTGVKVHPTDNLPQKVCDKCFQIVKSAKELRELSSKNNSYLRTLFDCEIAKELNQTCPNSSNCSTTDMIKTYYSEDSPSKEHKGNNNNISKRDNIAVRKDLFESSATISSSTTIQSENSNGHSHKKIKMEENTPLKCDICNKTFDKWKKLYCHQRSHNKTIVCPLDACGKKFATNMDLEKHFRTHTGEKPYQCNICKRSFSQRVTLKSHRESKHSEVNT